MGKGARSRELRNAKNQTAVNSGKVKKKSKTFWIALVCILLIGGCVAVTIINNVVNGPGAVRSTVAISTDNYKVSNADFSYFLNSLYHNYTETYSSFLTYLGLDTSKSLKSQTYTTDQTWFDYFAQSAEMQVNQAVLLCEAAKEKGFELDEENNALIDAYINNLKSGAVGAGYASLDSYLAAAYGKGVNEEVLRNCLFIEVLSSKYYEKYTSELEFSDEEMEKYYEDNTESFLYSDYKSYKIDAEVTEEGTDEDKTAAMEAAKEIAGKIAEAKSSEEFDSLLREYLAEHKSDGEGGEDLIDQTMESIVTTGYKYNTGTALGEWAFAEGRAAGDATVIEGDDYYTVYMMLKPAYRVEDPAKNLRMINISGENYNSDEEARAKADEVLAEFRAGDKSAESFAELAKEHSASTTVNEDGGLTENYVPSNSSSYSIDKWCLDPERKVGDADVVSDDEGGYIIVFYESDGIEAWKVTAKSGLTNDNFEKLIETLGETYHYTVYEDNIQKIDA
ncbi:MAG: peptidylprolyl isomerase [Clostridia bacterium]|nr:peptidylprolyl isomerase [Clostridia bacterium]